MLAQRVATAVVLLAVLLPALFAHSTLPFLIVTALLMVPAAWEWSRLNGAPGLPAYLCAALMLLLCTALVGVGPVMGAPSVLWWPVTALWALMLVISLHGGPPAWARWPRMLRWIAGLALLWLAWAAMARARVVGVNFLLSVLCIVWAADIAAYFGGRRFGRRKLAPTISPGKSWEGVASGLLGVVLLAFAWLAIDGHFAVDSPSVFSLLRQRLGLGTMVIGALVLAGFGVAGDLFESLVKRAAGAKDSSRLLPGHGGVLDRIDALLPALPVALALSAV